MNEFELRRLLGHGRGNFRDTVADEIDGRGAGKVEIFVAVRVPDVDAFAANGRGEIFAERSAEN